MTYIGIRFLEFLNKVLTKLGITSFGKALVYMAVILTIILTVLMVLTIISLKRNRNIAVNGGDLRMKSKYIKLLELLILAVSTIIPVAAALPVNSIYRFFGYFILVAVDAALMALYVAEDGQRYPYLIYGVLVILFTAVVSILIKNHFVGVGSNNYRSAALYTQGTITTYEVESVEGGFYYFIPVGAFNTVTLGIYTNIITPSQALYDSILALTIALPIILVYRRLGVKGAVLASFLLFVPSLSIPISRVDSLPYIAMALLILSIMLTDGSSIINSVIYALAVLTAIFAHPVGPIALTITLLVMYLTIPLLKIPINDRIRIRSIIGKAFMILIIMEFTYWLGTYIAIFLILEKVNMTLNALTTFSHTILGGKISNLYSLSPVVAPGYSSPETRAFAYVWAYPVALSLTLAMFGIFYGLNRLSKTTTINILGLIMGFSAAVGSVVSTAMGYADYTAGMATGQYLLPVAYFTALLGGVVAMSIVLKGRSRLVILAFTLIFAVFVLLGSYVPDWAPVENSSIFHVVATIHPYYVYEEASQISLIIPKYMRFYAQDGLPFGSQGKLPSAYILRAFSTCNYNTLLGVYMSQVPRCVLNNGDLSLMTTQGYAVLTPINS
ncbi:MAG: hypothetical protein ACP5NQ_06120 [Vulcanisaeta sp.]